MRGAVAFSTNRTNWMSRAIRWFTASPFSHSFIVTDTFYSQDPIHPDRVYLLEAGKREVSFSQLSQHEKPDEKYEIWMPQNVSREEINHALYRTQRVFLGKRYGYLQILGFAIVILLNKIRIHISNPIKLGTICSEVDWYYCKQIKPEFFNSMNRDTVSPKDLRELVIHSGEFKLIKHKDFT